MLTLTRMHTAPPGAPRTFACLVSGTLAEHERDTLVQNGLEPGEYVTVAVGIGQMNLGLSVDPTTGRAVWVIQTASALEGDALAVKQTAILDANGGAASRALQAAIPIGGSVRLVVRRDALHPDLRATVEAPRLDLSAFAASE